MITLFLIFTIATVLTIMSIGLGFAQSIIEVTFKVISGLLKVPFVLLGIVVVCVTLAIVF